MNYTITVKTGTSQEKIVKNPDGTLTVYLRAKPHDGEANTALLKLLSKHFSVPKTQIRILRGTHSHTKLISL